MLPVLIIEEYLLSTSFAKEYSISLWQGASGPRLLKATVLIRDEFLRVGGGGGLN